MPNNVSLHTLEKVLEKMSDGRSWYTRKLVVQAGISRETVRFATKELLTRGLIEISSNGRRPYFYRITPRGREFLNLLKAGREGRCSEGDPRSTRLSYPGSAPARPLKGGDEDGEGENNS